MSIDTCLRGLPCSDCGHKRSDEEYSEYPEAVIQAARTRYNHLQAVSMSCDHCRDAKLAFEDSLTDLPDKEDLGNWQVRQYFRKRGEVPIIFPVVDGMGDKPVRVTSYVRYCNSTKSSASRDRLKRVCQISAHNTSLKLLDATEDEPVLRVNNPVALLANVAPAGTVALVVIVVTHLNYKPMDGGTLRKGRGEMPLSLLNHPLTVVYGTIVELTWHDRDTMVSCHHTEAGVALKVSGINVCPLNPDQKCLQVDDGDSGTFSTLSSMYAIKDLKEIKEMLYSETRLVQECYPKLRNHNSVPYNGASGNDPVVDLIAFKPSVTSSSSSSSSSTSSTSSTSSSTIKMLECGICKKCVIKETKPKTQIARRLQHTACHIQFDNIISETNPCGLCGGASGEGKCNLSYTYKDRDMKAWINCIALNTQLARPLESMIQYPLKQMKKCVRSNPSTNHPLHCVGCGDGNKNSKPMIWSHNLEKHWALHHSNKRMPPNLVTAITLSRHELTWLKFSGPEGKQIGESKMKQLDNELEEERIPIQSLFGTECIVDQRKSKVTQIKYDDSNGEYKICVHMTRKRTNSRAASNSLVTDHGGEEDRWFTESEFNTMRRTSE